jgi:hypothetical protein
MKYSRLKFKEGQNKEKEIQRRRKTKNWNRK